MICLILHSKTCLCSSIWQPQRNRQTDLLLCFLCRHAGVNCGATSPFTLQSEVKHSHHHPHREDFVLQQHSMTVMGDDHWWLGRRGASCLSSEQLKNRVGETWFECNCQVLSPCNEASKVIKMLQCPFQILIRGHH